MKPFFVCNLGQRYGWVPEPLKARSEEVRRLARPPDTDSRYTYQSQPVPRQRWQQIVAHALQIHHQPVNISP